MTRKDTGITRIEDLKGKAIAVDARNGPAYLPRSALVDAGLSERGCVDCAFATCRWRLALNVAMWRRGLVLTHHGLC